MLSCCLCQICISCRPTSYVVVYVECILFVPLICVASVECVTVITSHVVVYVECGSFVFLMLWIVLNVAHLYFSCCGLYRMWLSCTSDVVDCIECGSVVLLMLWIISNVLSCTSDVVDCIECGSVVILMLWIVSNVAQLCLQAYNLFGSLFLSFAFIFSLDPLLDIRNVTVLKKLNTLCQ